MEETTKESAQKEPEKWIQRIRRTERIYKDKREETNRYKKAYSGNFSHSAKESSVSKYTLKVNFIYYFVETIIPSIFAADPKIIIKPKKDPMLAPAGKLLEYNTNYWARELNTKDEFKDCLFDSFFGPTAMYTGWEYETQMVKDKEQKYDLMGNPIFNAQGEPEMEEVEREFVLRDRPCVKWLDFWEEVRVDPDVKRSRQARWIAMRVTIPHDEFLQAANIKEEFKSGPRKIKPTLRPEDKAKEDYYSEERNDNKSDPEWVTYWEVWDREKMERKFVHESIKDDFLNEDIEWPYEMQFKDDPFPITIMHAKQDPFSNMSNSEFKAIEDQIWERVRLRSVQAGIVRRFAPKYVFAKGAGTKEQIKKFLTSDILSANELNNPDLIRMAPVPEIPPTFYQWDSIIEQDLGNVSGLSEFQRDKLANTATEATIAQGRAEVRRDARMREFEDFVVTVLGKMAMLCQQLQNRENVVVINGQDAQAAPDVFSITKDRIQGEYDFDIIAGSMSHNNEATELQNLQRFYEISLNGQDPEVNHRFLIETMAEYMGLDTKRALLSQEEKQNRAAQAAEAQQAQLQAKAKQDAEKDKIKFAPIKMEDINNPMDRVRVLEAAKAQNDVESLSPGPAIGAQNALGQLAGIPGGMGSPPGMPARPQMPNTVMPMNASRNMAGNPNPAVSVHPASLTPKR